MERDEGPYRFPLFHGAKSGASFRAYVGERYDQWKADLVKDAETNTKAKATHNEHIAKQRASFGAKAREATRKYFERKKEFTPVSFE